MGDKARQMAGNGENEQTRVCVTGAGGFLGSWTVKSLLSKGYLVHGTVRDPGDEKKNGHLKALEAASKNLQLFKADLFDDEGLYSAIDRCTGVIHVASPVPSPYTSNPQAELLEPAVTGTRNVLQACIMAKVKKVVIISSIGAVGAVWFHQNWPKNHQPMDESGWTDVEFLKTEIAKESGRRSIGFTKTTDMCYCLGKTMAEQEALDFGKRNEINIVTICPSIIVGPMLQSTVNSSSLFFATFLQGGTIEDRSYPIVDVRDAAEAALLVYENPKSKGRYICTSYDVTARVMVEKIQTMNVIPKHNNYPKEFIDCEEIKTYSSKKLQDLGWKHRSLDEIILGGIHNLLKCGLLPKP